MFEPLVLSAGTAVELLDAKKNAIASGILKKFEVVSTQLARPESAMRYELVDSLHILEFPHWVRLSDGTEFKIAEFGWVVGSNIQK